MGISRDFGVANTKKITLDRPWILDQNSNNDRLVQLLLQCARQRCSSMAAHSDWYPLKLAMVFGGAASDCDDCVKIFLEGMAAFEKANRQRRNEMPPGGNVDAGQ